MKPSATTAAGIVALSAAVVAEAQNTPSSTTKTVFLPSRPTGARGNIYASVITESSSTTKYLLACQTDFKPPYTCEGDFKGVTLTYGPTAIDVAFGATAYDCNYGKTAVCHTRTATSGLASTITVDSNAMSTWMTPITVLGATSTANSTTTSTGTASAQTTTAGSEVCKRDFTDDDLDVYEDDEVDIGGDTNLSNLEKRKRSKKKKKKKKKIKTVSSSGGDDACSEGTLPKISILGGVLALGVGALVNLVL